METNPNTSHQTHSTLVTRSISTDNVDTSSNQIIPSDATIQRFRHQLLTNIRPIVQSAGNLTQYVYSHPTSEQTNGGVVQNEPQSTIVNIELPSTSAEGTPPAQHNLHNQGNSANINPAHNQPGNEPIDNHEINREARECLVAVGKYIPCILMVLLKTIYDHQDAILNVILLFAIFANGNSVVKKEATKCERRNLGKLTIASMCIIIGIMFVYYVFANDMLYMSLIFNQRYIMPLTEMDLLWYVTVTELVIKLLTVQMKILIILIPAKIVEYSKRGKIFLFIESISQLYSSCITMPPWMRYWGDVSETSGKVIAAVLGASYFISKSAYLFSKIRMLESAARQLLESSEIGSSPSTEQLQRAGEHCPICHDEYAKPVVLQCRHIFCESCVRTWFDRERTCPLCRSNIVDDPTWRDGSTSYFLQLF